MEEGKKPDNPFEDFGGSPGKSGKRSMGGGGSLSKEQEALIIRLHSEGKSVREMAKQVGRSPGTVKRAMIRLKLTQNRPSGPAPILYPVLVKDRINIRNVLNKITFRADMILDKLQTLDESNAEKYGWLVLKACSEMRRYVQTEIQFYRELYSFERQQQFQQEVIALLGKVAPDARDEFVKSWFERNPV